MKKINKKMILAAAVCAAFLGLSPRFPFADNSITDKYYAFVSKR